MGQDLAQTFGNPLFDLLEPGLHSTHRIQPALTAVALGAAAVLAAEGVACDVVAGHSVGELAAWSIAGGASPVEAVQLAATRGQAMAAAAKASPGGMWAFDVEAVPDPLPEGLVAAVYNPAEVVLSGVGGRGRPIATAGPWHSPSMAKAQGSFAAALGRLPPRKLTIPMVSNHDGQSHSDDATLREHLVRQLTHPVRWNEVLATLRDLGVREVVVLGPGKILTSHLRRTPQFRVHRTDNAEALRATVGSLR